MVESGTGADLGGVAVHRGPEVSAEAAQLSARAYTTGGEVHLPQEHGPLSSGTGRSLLAHELTHVAQQRSLGSSLPPETSPAGARLEAEAQANEHAALHGGPQRSPLADRPSAGDPGPSWGTPSRSGPEPQRAPLATGARRPDPAGAALAAGIGALGPDGAVHFRPPVTVAAAQAPRSVQRAVVGASPRGVSQLPVVGAVSAPGAGSPAAQPAEAVQTDVADGPRSAEPPASVSFPELAPVADDAPQPAGGASPAPSEAAAEPDDEEELDALARRLWPRLHQRIRSDLLISRERTGNLVDRF